MSLLDGPAEHVSGAGDETAYREGYARVMREMSWARAHGFEPSEREIVLALMQAMKVYGTVRGGKSIGGRRPEWLHGRADALRALLRNGVGAMPMDGDDEDD
jgi:hypothetical protein